MTQVEAMELVTKSLLKNDIEAAQRLCYELREDLPTHTFETVLRVALRQQKLSERYERFCQEIWGRCQYQYLVQEMM